MKKAIQENMIGKLITTLSDKTKQLGNSINREATESIHAAKLLIKLIQGKEISPEEVDFIKKQGTDIAKSIALLGLQFVPGSSVGIIALEKAGKKYGFTLFPQRQEIPPTAAMNEVRKLVRQTISEYITEDINVPINVGDEVFGGKFKNKKIVVKDIGKNEKGDITINDKPLLRFRIKKQTNK